MNRKIFPVAQGMDESAILVTHRMQRITSSSPWPPAVASQSMAQGQYRNPSPLVSDRCRSIPASSAWTQPWQFIQIRPWKLVIAACRCTRYTQLKVQSTTSTDMHCGSSGIVKRAVRSDLLQICCDFAWVYTDPANFHIVKKKKHSDCKQFCYEFAHIVTRYRFCRGKNTGTVIPRGSIQKQLCNTNFEIIHLLFEIHFDKRVSSISPFWWRDAGVNFYLKSIISNIIKKKKLKSCFMYT